ncbi:hypothetical protein GPECTOR_3g463 [Gonium pectorale]|uniref:Exonuclease domain-containing protein n=1 Tax=Gonium pectorale TaxID=33097 RepID=A0A150GZQ8_GONPE|nr:hypothetical protein GPECTOR_3g463 [Gonium pectorale]|eukprot:KXZ55331.1 hypothetical protein GPECTOR_3g463 [Gonium pectorale]
MAPLSELVKDATVVELQKLIKALQKHTEGNSWEAFVKARYKVLEEYLAGLGSAPEAAAAAGEAGGEGGGDGGGGGATQAAEFVKSYLKWAHRVQKDEEQGRGVLPTPPEADAGAGAEAGPSPSGGAVASSSQQQLSVWSLVRRTRAHVKYGKHYGELPSYLPGWHRTKSGLPDCTAGLKDLASVLLGLEMREQRGGAHDSLEDAGVTMRLVMRELQMARPTPPVAPPRIRVPPSDQAKLLVHCLPGGATEEALRRAFAAVDAPAFERLEGNLAEKKVLLVFGSKGDANLAFTKLRAAMRTDAMGRPWKEVSLGDAGSCKVRKMAAHGDVAFGGAAAGRGAKPSPRVVAAKRGRISQAARSREAAEGVAAAAGGDSVQRPSKRQKREGGGAANGGGGAGDGAAVTTPEGKVKIKKEVKVKAEEDVDPVKAAGKGGQKGKGGQQVEQQVEQQPAGKRQRSDDRKAGAADVLEGAPAGSGGAHAGGAGDDGAAVVAGTPAVTDVGKGKKAKKVKVEGGQTPNGGAAPAAGPAEVDEAGGKTPESVGKKGKKDKSGKAQEAGAADVPKAEDADGKESKKEKKRKREKSAAAEAGDAARGGDGDGKEKTGKKGRKGA